MIPIETLLVFMTASVLLCLAPGPDNIFVLTQSAVSGRRAGLLVMLGLCSGLVVHTLAVALGVAVIFQISALAFTLLKLAGAGYLLYLAWLAFRASFTRLSPSERPRLSNMALYRRGIIMNLTNPKVGIFFLAFLPQFADPIQGPASQQIIMLGGLFILSALVVFSLIAVLSSFLNQWLTHSPIGQKILNQVAGLVFVGLALRLAFSEQ